MAMQARKDLMRKYIDYIRMHYPNHGWRENGLFEVIGDNVGGAATTIGNPLGDFHYCDGCVEAKIRSTRNCEEYDGLENIRSREICRERYIYERCALCGETVVGNRQIASGMEILGFEFLPWIKEQDAFEMSLVLETFGNGGGHDERLFDLARELVALSNNIRRKDALEFIDSVEAT